MRPRLPLRSFLMCTVLLGGLAAEASANGVICTDRWGHRYTMVKPPTTDLENITCVNTDGSAVRRPPAGGRASRAVPVPSATGPDRTYTPGTQPPAPVTTAVAKPTKAGLVEPNSVLGLKNPLPPGSTRPADADRVFGFGGSVPLPPAAPASGAAPSR